MRKTVIQAAAAVVENKKIIKPAFINIENDIIVKISDSNPCDSSAELLDLKDMVLFPGFINAHCHLELTDIGPLKKDKFVPWIRHLMSHKKEQTPERLIDSVHQGIKLNLKSGVTTIIDHVSYNTPAQAFKDAPVRVIAFGEALGVDNQFAEFIFSELKKLQKESSVPFFISPHTIHTVAPDLLRKLFYKRTTPFSIHLHESKTETDYFEHHAGEMWDFIHERLADLKHIVLHDAKSAIQYIKNHKWDLSDTLIIHANDLCEKDFEILKSLKNICIVHCPGSFEFFEHDEFHFFDIMKHKISLALGTDSITSNTELNFLNEIHLFLKKYPQTDLFEFLPMITTNALKPLHLKNIGMIKEGFQADMIGFKNPENIDFITLLKTKKKVDFVMVGGLVSVC